MLNKHPQDSMLDETVETESNISVKILFFSVLREKVGQPEMVVNLPEQVKTGKQFLEYLIQQFPALEPYKNFIRLAVNESYVPIDTVLKEGDRIALITPVSGG